MDAKELRIGNNIEYCGTDFIVISEMIGLAEEDNNIFEPIPLTEEWLFKFGFQIDDKDECYIYDTVHLVSLYKGINGGYQRIINGYNDGVELNHVHQLQNLYFALTGEELKQK